MQVFLGEAPPWLSPGPEKEEVFYVASERNETGNPIATFRESAAGSYFRILYAEGAEFILDRRGTQVWGTWTGNLSLQDALVYLLGPVMGFLLRLRGMTSLHASAVAVDSRAIALVGPPGAGKSTTAASFARRGYPVVSDDIVPLVDHGRAFSVQSGYPCVCLWPESVETLYGSSDSLPLLTPTWNKRYLPLEDSSHRFQLDPMPLAAVYLLGDRAQGAGRPFAHPVPAADGLISLIANTYMNYLPDANARVREFELLGRLAGTVPIRRVQPHSDPAYLNKLCDAIVEDFQGLRLLAGEFGRNEPA